MEIDSFNKRSLELYIDKKHIRHIRDMDAIDQKKVELRCKIDSIFSKMSIEARNNIYIYIYECNDGIHLILIVDNYYPDYNTSFYGTLPQVLEAIRCFYDTHPDIYDPVIVHNHWSRPYSCEVEQVTERDYDEE